MNKKPNAFTVGLFAFVGVFLFMPNTLNNANLRVKFSPLIRRAEIKYGIPEDMLFRLIKTESNFNPNAYNAGSGAIGLGQFVLKWHPNITRDQALNPDFAIDYAGKYLSSLAKQLKGDWKSAVAAYNWGIGNLQKQGIANAPLETVNYIKKVYYG